MFFKNRLVFVIKLFPFSYTFVQTNLMFSSVRADNIVFSIFTCETMFRVNSRHNSFTALLWHIYVMLQLSFVIKFEKYPVLTPYFYITCLLSIYIWVYKVDLVFFFFSKRNTICTNKKLDLFCHILWKLWSRHTKILNFTTLSILL